MEKQTFKVGDAVKHRYERIRGIVIKLHSEYEAYYVKWNDEDFNDDDDNTGGTLYHSESLDLYSVEIDAAQSNLIQAKIDEATAHLEAVFAALREAHKMETGTECDEGFP